MACGGAAQRPPAASPPAPPKPTKARVVPEASPEVVHHLLSRFSFGPAPAEAARVRELGIEGWLERQLAKAPDPGGEAALEPYRAATLPPRELAEEFADGELDEEMPGKALLKQIDFKELLLTVQMAALARHVASERQVQEVMVDFWTNHFNVFARKGFVKLFAADFVERAIRPHALGRFEELLIATAEHPAMLIYLDNAKSVAARPAGKRGLNENYARELLELHTLGVDGGYSQADVIEVARILTGWSVRRPREGQLGFMFRKGAHDFAEKRALGTTYPAGRGREEGLELLRALARHPSTARHLGKKLCARFVADQPPRGCVERVEKAYKESHGDVRALLRATVRSPELWAPDNRGAKLKTPLEFVTSSLRALEAKPDGTLGLSRVLGSLGQPLLLMPVPTGYAESADAWTSSGALLARMNTAAAIGSGRLPGIQIDLDRVLPAAEDREKLVSAVDARLLGGRGSAQTLAVIRREIASETEPETRRAIAIALALGSPDFQRQ